MVKRTDSQIKEGKSFTYVKETLNEWVVNRLHDDYGIDFDIQIYEKGENTALDGTGLNFGAQIKSTETTNISKTHLKCRLDIDHIDYFVKQERPILLIVYHMSRECAFWVVMQEYVWDILNQEKPNWRSQN